MAKQEIFRKVALDRLASPEQLDQLMHVTRPKGWIALATLGTVLLLAIIWSITGSIPERIPGQAILLRSGGVFEVVSQSGGRVADLPIQVGDTISEGQVVVRLAQPELHDQLRRARGRLAELELQHARITALVARDAELQAISLAHRRTNIEQSLEANKRAAAHVEERIATQQKLVAQGLVARPTLLASQQEYELLQERIRASSSDLAQLSVQTLQTQSQEEQQVQTISGQLLEARADLAGVESDLKLQGLVTTPYSGQVLEVMAEQGGIVERGKPILTLSLTGNAVKALEVVVYVPSIHGKKIHRGMDIQIVPSTVKREEFGFLLGKVTYVSDFPATPQGMLRVLKNSTLVTALSGQDAPYEVHADLIPDAASPSQFRWSSSKGPPTRLQSGTLAVADIVVRNRRPILLVIPQLERALGAAAQRGGLRLATAPGAAR